MEQALQSTRFGTFVYDPTYDWFEAKTRFGDAAITLNLHADKADEVAQLLAHAEDMAADEAHWLARLQQCAAGLTDIANAWNEEEDAWDGPIDSASFVSRITLTSIGLFNGSMFEAYFDDGNLFWGHSIVVRGTIADGPQEAETVG